MSFTIGAAWGERDAHILRLLATEMLTAQVMDPRPAIRITEV